MARQTLLRIALAALVTGLAVGVSSPARAGDLDWSAWREMPVFHNGRMMPLNTFARIAAERICGRANPRLAPPETGLDSQRAAAARRLFPDGKPRRFDAAELLFSWMVEPEAWEDVPFLLAAHETLRTDLLGQPLMSREGVRLNHVSPRQVVEAPALRAHLVGLSQRRNNAAADGEEPELSTLDKRAQELYSALRWYRLLTYNPAAPVETRNRMMERLTDAAHTWSRAARTWRQIEADFVELGLADSGSSPGDALESIAGPLERLRASTMSDDASLATLEAPLVSIRRAAEEVAQACRQYTVRLARVDVPDGWTSSRLAELRKAGNLLASDTWALVQQSLETHLALYDNGFSLRLVPALNPGALEKNRLPEDDAQPWLNVQTLIVGSPDILRGYPRDMIQDVREAFERAAVAYLDRGDAARPQRVGAALRAFAASVRDLAETVEPVRGQLPIKERDEELIAVTAYPPVGAMRAEVDYYRVDPFFWSWLVSFLAMGCFGLAFGVARKPMFWVGIVVLLAAQAMTIYGFGLRVYITGWAPVTNMFETVVFVAVVSALLGVWFALLPLFGPGLKDAWRMTAVPGTFEAVELTEDQAARADRDRWNRAGWLLLLPRAALAAAIFGLLTLYRYGAGEGYTAVSLLPRTATANDLTVWIVGLAMLALLMLYVPRAIVTMLAALVAVPQWLRRHGTRRPVEQTMARKPFALAGAFVAFLAALIAYYAPISGKNISLLMPVLRDNFWLTVHVLSITASYGAGFLALGLGLLALGYYLFGRYRDPADGSEHVPAEDHRPAGGYIAPADSFRRRPPEACATLGGFIYRATQVAFLLLAAGTITGALWADVSWGRFWGWDPKEVWALVSLLVYAAVLHGRYAGMFGNFGLTIASVFGATSILMAWYGVNYVLPGGLHSYGEGTGGQGPVLLSVLVIWAFTGIASIRYLIETRTSAPPRPGAPTYLPATKAVELVELPEPSAERA